MDTDDLIRILIFLLVVIIPALLGSRKRKQQRSRAPDAFATDEEARADVLTDIEEPDTALDEVMEPAEEWERDMAAERDRVAAEEMSLREPAQPREYEEAAPTALPKIEPPPPQAQPEALELESLGLQPVGEAGQEDFRALVADSSPAEAVTRAVKLRQRLLSRRRNLREAILWREILGPPKALE